MNPINETESVESGLALSKLVSKLEARSWKLGKYELRVSTTGIYTSIDNFKRKPEGT